MSKIGFIGLGNMGAPMAINLAKVGHKLKCFDASADAMLATSRHGLASATSFADVVEDADVVILMLPSGSIVATVAKEILPVMKKGSLLIDCSTIDVASAKSLQTVAAKFGVHCLDAPVSGGVGGATAGTLTFMVGGSAKAFTVGAPLFEAMGQRAVHCGDGGSGQAAKICNNMLLGISMIGACEAFSLAESLGLSKEALFKVISTSSGSCWSVNTYCPVPGVGPKSPADNNYKAGFAANLMLKDLGLSQVAASQTHANTPLGAHAAKLYKQMVDEGLGDMDFSGIITQMKTKVTTDAKK
ncbi:MAG: 3-hydroxyisobutyrate dehydrogenase [Hyphomicrobiales bacterium]|nr:MAG: 3-hydroxyisobutyrate dehydrogenase [Hyphomicrobiales bacterium]